MAYFDCLMVLASAVWQNLMRVQMVLMNMQVMATLSCPDISMASSINYDVCSRWGRVASVNIGDYSQIQAVQDLKSINTYIVHQNIGLRKVMNDHPCNNFRWQCQFKNSPWDFHDHNNSHLLVTWHCTLIPPAGTMRWLVVISSPICMTEWRELRPIISFLSMGVEPRDDGSPATECHRTSLTADMMTPTHIHHSFNMIDPD